jgi:hypothetical protein
VETKPKVRGRPIQKGQVLNPLGRKAHNPALQAVRKMGRDELAELGKSLFGKTRADVEKMARDPATPILQQIILMQLVNASKGSGNAFDRILDRIVGKVQDDIKVSADIDVKVSSDQMAAMATAALKRSKGGNE